MVTIHENEYLIIKVDNAKSIYHYTWKPEGEDMDLSDYMREAALLLELFQKNPYENVIADGTSLKIIIPPDIQEKLNDNIITKLNKGVLKKYAHISSKNIITNMSQEQMFDENIDKTYEDRYFESVEEALNWIA